MNTTPLTFDPNLTDYPEDRFNSITRTPHYFGSPDKPLIGWIHTATNSINYNTCLVICPPLGVEYMSTYRSLRYVADYFALAGIPVLRFDYHGTGDSSGFNLDEDRLPDWLESIEQACYHLQRVTGLTAVSLLGFRMGATLASLVSEKILLESLILWAPQEKGKRFNREIKALQLTSSNTQVDKEDALLEAGGIVYWKETEESIAKLDLFKILPKAKRVLIIPKDDQKINSKLKDHWHALNLNVTQLNLNGSAEMLRDAYFTTVPHQSIIDILEWLTPQLDTIETLSINKDLLAATNCKINVPKKIPCGVTTNSFQLKDQFFTFCGALNGFSIMTENYQGVEQKLPRVIFTNSGATHRVGPSRLYVTLSRQLANYGFQVFRLDIPGLGDNYINNRVEEHEEYIDNSNEVIASMITQINAIYGDGKYLISGLCSGAYFSFHAALHLPNANIVESILINPLTFYWEKGMSFETTPARNFSAWNWYLKALGNKSSWKKLLRGKIDFKFLFHTIKERIKIKIKGKAKNLGLKTGYKNDQKIKNDLDTDLTTIANNNTQLTLLLSKNDPGFDLLMTSGGSTAKKLIKANKLHIYEIDDADHTFSKFIPRTQAIKTLVNHIVRTYVN